MTFHMMRQMGAKHVELHIRKLKMNNYSVEECRAMYGML